MGREKAGRDQRPPRHALRHFPLPSFSTAAFGVPGGVLCSPSLSGALRQRQLCATHGLRASAACGELTGAKPQSLRVCVPALQSGGTESRKSN